MARAFAGAWSFWPLVAAAAATLLCAWFGRDTATALAAGLALGGALARASPPAWMVPHSGWAPRSRSARSPCASRAHWRGTGSSAPMPPWRRFVIVITALLAIFIFFPVGKALLAAVEDREGRFAPALVVGASVHRRYLGHRLPGRRHALRRGHQFRSARDDRRHGVDAAGACSRAARAARRSALCGAAEAHVDAADHHAALRDRARDHCAVRSDRPRHRLAGCLVRRSPHRAGSTACPASRSRNCCRSRRSPS